MGGWLAGFRTCFRSTQGALALWGVLLCPGSHPQSVCLLLSAKKKKKTPKTKRLKFAQTPMNPFVPRAKLSRFRFSHPLPPQMMPDTLPVLSDAASADPQSLTPPSPHSPHLSITHTLRPGCLPAAAVAKWPDKRCGVRYSESLARALHPNPTFYPKHDEQQSPATGQRHDAGLMERSVAFHLTRTQTRQQASTSSKLPLRCDRNRSLE